MFIKDNAFGSFLKALSRNAFGELPGKDKGIGGFVAGCDKSLGFPMFIFSRAYRPLLSVRSWTASFWGWACGRREPPGHQRSQ